MFSQLSQNITKNLDQTTKKSNGIYFTPPKITQMVSKLLYNYANKNNLHIKAILEPSCGSGEFINSIISVFNGDDNIPKIDAIEYNEYIYNEIKTIDWGKGIPISITHNDYLKTDTDNKYDIIVGNPPYYVTSKTKIAKEYHPYFTGRPNIYIPFIIHSINKLNPNGLLAFVLPKNFTNCLYYNKLREFLYNTLTIIDIIDFSDEKYIETGQDTIVIIIQNTAPPDLDTNNQFTINIGNNTIFNTQQNIELLKGYYKGKTTLDQLGYNVNVGTVVWNEHKDILTSDNKKTLLVYSGDIKDNTLSIVSYKNIEKKNYIDKVGGNNPMLVVNRGYGKGKYVFNYCIIDIEGDYLVENHLICIVPKDEDYSNRSEVIDGYNKIVNAFNSENTSGFIKLYFGNNAINTTELQYILPI